MRREQVFLLMVAQESSEKPVAEVGELRALPPTGTTSSPWPESHVLRSNKNKRHPSNPQIK